MINVNNRIVRNIDCGRHANVLFRLNLSSASDTVVHAILLEVLERRFGVTEIALKLYCSYVDGRTQTLQFGSQLSAMFLVHCSVHESSVLRALKFVTYTEDLPAVIQRIAIYHHLYTDDTQLSDEPPSIVASISNMELCVDAVHAWCSAKRLQLNPSKSEIICFGTLATPKRLENTNLSLYVGMNTVTPSNIVRDLGVLLNSELTMRQHISKIVGVCFYHL